MAELKVECPVCKSVLKSKSEAQLVRMLREHATQAHSMDMPQDEARRMVKVENLGQA